MNNSLIGVDTSIVVPLVVEN